MVKVLVVTRCHAQYGAVHNHRDLCDTPLAMDDPDRINAATELLGGLKVISRLSGYGLSHRPYASRIRERRSTLLTMSLPRSFCVLVGIYAEMHTISCNEVYCEFLKRGLLIYLKAHATLFESSK